MPSYGELMLIQTATGANEAIWAMKRTPRAAGDGEEEPHCSGGWRFSGPKAIRAVGTYLKQHDVLLTAFYLSNVEQYLFQQGASGAVLPQREALRWIPRHFIRSSLRSRRRAKPTDGTLRSASLLGSIPDL